jgi:SAM-dependent methyltransferase
MNDAILDRAAARYSAPDTGAAYFAWQKPAGTKAAIYNRKFFAPFVRPEDRLLDFGCGGGYLLHALPARSKTGIEINPAAQAEARGLGIEVAATLEELRGREFEVALSSHSLEHVANPYGALVGLRKLLWTGGKLVLLLPVDDWRNERLKGPWNGPDINGHLYAWTPRLLGNLLAASGFEPVFIRVVNQVWPPRFDRFFWTVSPAVFEMAAYLSSVLLRRRQLWAVAEATR